MQKELNSPEAGGDFDGILGVCQSSNLCNPRCIL